MKKIIFLITVNCSLMASTTYAQENSNRKNENPYDCMPEKHIDYYITMATQYLDYYKSQRGDRSKEINYWEQDLALAQSARTKFECKCQTLEKLTRACCDDLLDEPLETYKKLRSNAKSDWFSVYEDLRRITELYRDVQVRTVNAMAEMSVGETWSQLVNKLPHT
jgi:hypothetical protein